MEWKLFDTPIPYVSTYEFHKDRERAPHLEQPAHKPRLRRAAVFVKIITQFESQPMTVSDLGCGDGGLLSLIQTQTGIADAWGYDFAPANTAGWQERDVKAELRDVFGADRDEIKLGEISCVTEVLEHIANPLGTLRWIGQTSKYVVASSPVNETLNYHASEHAWAWDYSGYALLFNTAHYDVIKHDVVDSFQLILARSDQHDT